jgi:RHS repeat-associated protein
MLKHRIWIPSCCLCTTPISVLCCIPCRSARQRPRVGSLPRWLPRGIPDNTGYDDGVVTTADMVQENHYYPFGMNMEGNWNGAAGNNKYQYNGKEWNDDFGLNWNDYGKRFYDPAMGRWAMVDSLGEHPFQRDKSPYAYAWDNPMKYTDPDGHCPFCPLVFVAEIAEEAYLAYRAYRTAATIVTTVGAVSSLPSVAVPIELQTSTMTQRSTVQRDATATKGPLNLNAKKKKNENDNTENNNTGNNGKTSTDSSKNQRHGDDGRALEKAQKQITELEKQLEGATKKEAAKIKQTIKNIKDAAHRKNKGEEHHK